MRARLFYFLACLLLACGQSPPAADEVAPAAKTLESYREAAEQGDATAQYLVGSKYIVNLDFVEAAKWLRLAAEQDSDASHSAQHLLATLYDKGLGVPQDYAEAAQWYRLAAGQGYEDSQLALGELFHIGKAVPQDYGEAAKWYRLAAEQGNDEAQKRLGLMYRQGRGVTQHYGEAFKWLRLSGEQGNGNGQSLLAGMYLTGEGIRRDYVLAHMWYNLAASGPAPADETGADIRPMAIAARATVESFLTSAQLAEAQRLAREWKPKTWEELNATE